MANNKKPSSVIDLDPDLKQTFNYYKMIGRACKFLAIVLGLLGLIGIIFVLRRFGGLGIGIGELGSYIGGTFGPYFTLVGFFVLIATLYSQQSQSLYQNQAIRNQNRQFTLQSFDSSFFNLLNHYLSFSDKYTIKVAREKFTVQEYKTKLGHWRPYFKVYLEERNCSADIPSSELQQWLFDKFSTQQNQVKNLFKPLISMLFFLEDGKIDDKEKYYRMLDYQVTESEKFILFYFFITTPKYFTDEEMPVVRSFLKRIDQKTLIHPDHLAWLEA